MTDDQLRTLDRLLALADDLHDACARAACISELPPSCLRMIRMAWHAVEAQTAAHAAQTAPTPKRPGPVPKRPKSPNGRIPQTAAKNDGESK